MNIYSEDKVITTSARLPISTGNDAAMKTVAGIKKQCDVIQLSGCRIPVHPSFSCFQ